MVNKYKMLINHLSILKKDGKYEDLSSFEQNFLQRKIKSLFVKIERLSKSFGVKVAGTALALLLVSGAANSQEFVFKNTLKHSMDLPITGYNPSTAYTDIDGDGNFELVLANGNGDITSYTHISGTNFKSNGLVKFTDEKYFNLLSYPVIDFTDIDGDGDEDMFVGLKDGHIQVYENDNGFEFLDTLLCGTNDGFGDNAAITLADFDDDGDEDLFIGNKAGNVAWAEHDGSGVFSDTTNFLDLTGTPLDIDKNCPTPHDFNDDGHMDLLIADGTGYADGYSNNGSGLFDILGHINAGGTSINSDDRIYPRWYDFDADGTDDLMANYNKMIAFYKDNGTTLNAPLFLTSDELSYTDEMEDIDYFDFDKDGDLDLFLSSESIAYYKNNGDGTYLFDSYLEADGSDIEFASNIFPAFNDFDGDGDVDIIIGSGDTLCVYENNAGVFNYTDVLSDNNGVIRRSDANPVFGDIDGSEKLYVGDGTNIFVYSNNSGNFIDEGFLQLDGVNMASGNFAFTDINDDNITDIVFYINPLSYFVSATNDGSGNLSTNDTITNSGNIFIPLSIGFTFADVDGDGTDEFYILANLSVQRYNSPHATGLREFNTVDVDFSKVYSYGNNITVELTDVKNANVEIYNVSGKMILNEKLLNNRTDFNGLEKGLYLVKVYSEKGINLAKVIVE